MARVLHSARISNADPSDDPILSENVTFAVY